MSDGNSVCLPLRSCGVRVEEVDVRELQEGSGRVTPPPSASFCVEEPDDEGQPRGRALYGEDVAQVRIVGFLGRYPEKASWIYGETQRLLRAGTPIPAVEQMLGRALEAMEPQIYAEREERERLIRDRGTRGRVEPLTDYESRLAALLDGTDAIHDETEAKVAAKNEEMAVVDDEIARRRERAAQLRARAAGIRSNVPQTPPVAAGPEGEQSQKKKFSLFGSLSFGKK
jgi:hypothetical protein